MEINVIMGSYGKGTLKWRLWEPNVGKSFPIWGLRDVLVNYLYDNFNVSRRRLFDVLLRNVRDGKIWKSN